MKCNIDRRGRTFRLVSGILTLFVAIVLGGFVLADTISQGWWIAVVLLLLAGGFSIFEARKGWCAVRAMGVRTPV